MKFLNLERPNLAYAYLLRVPLLVAAAILFFLYLATTDGAGAYIRGMYDIGPKAALAAGGAAFLAWLALTVSTNTILRTAEDRFGVDPLPDWAAAEVHLPAWLQIDPVWCTTVISAALYAVVVFLLLSGLVWVPKDGVNRWPDFCVAVLGFALALILVEIGWLVIPNRPTSWIISLLFWTRWTPQGYRQALDLQNGVQHYGEVLPVHNLALRFMALSLFLFSILGFLYPGNAFGTFVQLATLPCIILIFANSCWILSAITYLLDHWRVPLFVPILAYAILTARFLGSSDHVFPIANCGNSNCQSEVTAAHVMRRTGPPAVLVATSGGGILASAWTARVLGELDRETQGAFSQSVRLISSVSGGSVGAMYFQNRLREKTLNSGELLNDAARSSLDDVAWALTYPDTLRTFPLYRVIFGQDQDRGEALRSSWARGHEKLSDVEATLGTWKLTPTDQLPALILNSTVDETGERFMFANYQVKLPTRAVRGVREFFDEFGKQSNIAITTAVGASAAFPYVSPAARPNQKKNYHLVDGGYYDNFGVVSALDFLDEASVPTATPLLLILIEASPERYYKVDDTVGVDKGWSYQLIAPPNGLIGMWQIAARSRNFATLDWVKRVYPNLQIVRFVYEAPDGKNYPTSWHLSNHDQEQIKGGLTRGHNPVCFETAKQYLASPGLTPGKPCYEETKGSK